MIGHRIPPITLRHLAKASLASKNRLRRWIIKQTGWRIIGGDEALDKAIERHRNEPD